MMKFVACFVLMFILFCSRPSAQIRIISALCENKVDPTGVSLQNLRFSWELDAKENNQYQTSYQLVMSSSKEKMAKGNYDVYNSGIVKNSQNVLVPYKGKPLMPAQIYYWKVRVWDKSNKQSTWCDDQKIITGLFSKKDWTSAKWIGYEQLNSSMRVAPGVDDVHSGDLENKCIQRAVVPLFRRKFSVLKKVKNALLFITGLGQYELSINGKKEGTAFLAPGWTYFDKTILYNTFDVTSKLLPGKNSIGVMVGNGFYNINRERYYKIVSAFGMPTMICRLKIIYTDGSVENIVSDKSWKTSPSAITYSSIYGGEDYDARLEQEGWNTALFNDTKWSRCLQIKSPRGQLLPEQDYPVTLMDSFEVKKIWHPSSNIYVYDFGQNASGIVKLIVRGRKGQTIKLIPAELINKIQLANQTASGSPYYFSYTLKSDTDEIWQPRFTYYGFRYVQVEGAVPDTSDNKLSLPIILQLKSMHNRNANPVNGSFECSNKLFNSIYTLINWAIKSNMQSIITDCPAP